MPILYSAGMWINEGKKDEHIKLIHTFPSKEEADAFLSQVDSDAYIILEIDAEEWMKVKEHYERHKAQ